MRQETISRIYWVTHIACYLSTGPYLVESVSLHLLRKPAGHKTTQVEEVSFAMVLFHCQGATLLSRDDLGLINHTSYWPFRSLDSLTRPGEYSASAEGVSADLFRPCSDCCAPERKLFYGEDRATRLGEKSEKSSETEPREANFFRFIKLPTPIPHHAVWLGISINSHTTWSCVSVFLAVDQTQIIYRASRVWNASWPGRGQGSVCVFVYFN